MTKTQEKKASYAKANLEKALKSRLAALTQGLGDADVGDRGIDLVKEIKELYTMIAALSPDAKAQKQENAKIEVGWAEWENMPKQKAQTNNQTKAQAENQLKPEQEEANSSE